MKNKIFYLSLIILLPIVNIVKSDVGGHDLFTSLAQLEVLWYNEIEIIKVMERAITNMEKATKSLQNYIKSHKELNLDQKPNYDFLGHPLNAYHFVRHVAARWHDVHNEILGNNTLSEDIKILAEREKEKLPDLYDVQGGAYGIVRLKSLYDFKLKPFVQEGVITATLDNGQKVRSQPSVLKPNSFDLYTMSQEGWNSVLLNTCTDFLEATLEVGKKEHEQNISLTQYFGHVHDPATIKNDLKTAIFLHDRKLDQKGPKSALHRTHRQPFDKKLRKKKKFKNPKVLPRILGRENMTYFENQREHESELAETILPNIEEDQRDVLCRGKEIRPANMTRKLKCFYGTSDSVWLKIGPFKIEENSHDPYHVIIHDMLYDNECDKITQFLGPMLDFPPGRMNGRKSKNDWTMKNCWPKENQNEELQKLNRRLEHISGLHANSYKNYSEPYMCGNYGIGGHYWLHPDYHFASEKHYHPMSSGNRVATILTILENPIAGGATVWPYAGISVFGKKGAALFWHNTFSSDIPDKYTRHVACPVLLGQKWIGNKWVGYNAQWNGRKCLLNPLETFKPIRHFQKI